ncbi:MAG: tetratricopeptide repeat protein [Spartobacteria bacterium]
MMIRKTVFLLLFTLLASTGVAPAKSQLETMYDKAFQAFDAAKYDEALQALDAIDKRQPDLAESLNLRGVVYMRQEKYDKAEAALRKALALEPKFWNASFNLAEIPFLQKNWVEARNRFEALVAGENNELQPETNQLIQYKILLTFVLQGKKEMVDWILNKFELTKDSPALYYSNAAIALQQGNEAEAADWRSSAEKKFSAPLNKLYAESFYEVGWLKKPNGEPRAAVEITSTAERQERLKGEAQANLEKAERSFQKREFDPALKFLDLADEGVPNNPVADNLRGEILIEQEKYDDAEAALRKAFEADPKFREAQYNLAQIPFKKGEYSTSRDRFEALFAETPGDEKNQAAQLIKFKIFLTLLLEGKDPQAQQLMDQFKFTGDTPALYYAQAAWEFKHGKTSEGTDWVGSARKIYSPAMNVVFSDSFYDLGWLKKSETDVGPATSALAQAEAEPVAMQDKPTLRLSQANDRPEPDLTTDGAPVEASPAAAATPAPVVTSAAATVVPAVAKSAAPVVAATTTNASPAATALEPARAGAWSPTFAETADRIMRPQTLLFGGLLLAGLLLLVWLVMQQFRRHLSSPPLYRPSAPLTEPPFADEESPKSAGSKRASDLVSTGPPKLSLNLKASEPTVGAAVFPSGAITARGALPGVDEPTTVSPNESPEPKTEVVPVPAAAIPVAPQVFEPVTSAPEPMRSPYDFEITETAPVAAIPEPEVVEPAPVAAISEPEIAEPVPVAATAEPEIAPTEEPAWTEEEPVGQGQPIPELTTALAPEPVISELTQPEPESTLELIEPGVELAAPIAGRRPAYSSIETPSFASKIISTEPIRPQPNIPVTMPETTITPAPTFRAPSPTVSVQQPVGGMHTAVQLTFSLEIASMQLTPTFKMSGLQLKPTSKVVSMRLAPSQNPQPPMNLQVTFEVAKIELNNGAIGTVRLAPSSQQKPAVLTSPSFAISGLELVAGSGAAPVQLTPSHQEQASVQLTAEFQIAAIEFTPFFEIAHIVLTSTSKKVSMQLPGSGPSTIDGAPVFEVENVQLGAGDELGLIQVAPGR